MKRIGVVFCAMSLVFAACGGGDERPAGNQSTQTASPTAAPKPCSVQGGSTESQRSQTKPTAAPLTDLRWEPQQAGKHGCPRIVFEFRDHQPGYVVEYAKPPFSECGSGETVSTDSWGATAFLRVRLEPSGSVDMESPDAAVTYKGSRDIDVGGRVLKRMKVVCDFEAVFEWIVGLDARHDFSVFTLDDPARIVIDVSEE
jgi:hypothetical protein